MYDCRLQVAHPPPYWYGSPVKLQEAQKYEDFVNEMKDGHGKELERHQTEAEKRKDRMQINKNPVLWTFQFLVCFSCLYKVLLILGIARGDANDHTEA